MNKWFRAFVSILVLFVLLLPVNDALAKCDGYVVRRGDTLFRIAVNHGTTWRELARLNGIPNPARIYVGQCIAFESNYAYDDYNSAPVSTPVVAGIKGIAFADPSHAEDLSALRATWHYMWGEYCGGAAGCINMVRSMQIPVTCYDVLLVGNEPNALEPNGAPISPQDAVNKVRAIQSQCPSTKLIVGNVSADDWSSIGGWGSGYNWLRAFMQSYPNYSGGIGVHCYSQHSAQWCIDQLSAMRGLYAGEMWVTEFAILSGDTTQFNVLLDYVSSNFARYSAYTNRQPSEAYSEGWAIGGADMVRGDGSLTPIGQIYSSR
jgi:hypothetical protein